MTRVCEHWQLCDLHLSVQAPGLAAISVSRVVEQCHCQPNAYLQASDRDEVIKAKPWAKHMDGASSEHAGLGSQAVT